MKAKLTLPSYVRASLVQEDGSISREWQRFFTDLFNRVGGTDSQSDDITDADGTLADATRAINAILAALREYKVITDD